MATLVTVGCVIHRAIGFFHLSTFQKGAACRVLFSNKIRKFWRWISEMEKNPPKQQEKKVDVNNHFNPSVGHA